MAQAAEMPQSGPAELQITPEARKRITPLQERMYRELHDAALADGGAEAIRVAKVIWRESIDSDDDKLRLVYWVDGSHDDARNVYLRMLERDFSLRGSLTEEECKVLRELSYGANPYSLVES